jgi:hypothetical protein
VRGSIIAPNGVPQINPSCGLEIFVAGSNWWPVNGCWNQVRGIMEFDLRTLLGAPYRRVTLSLQDTGSTASGAPQTTNVLGFTGDGALRVEDWGAPASFVTALTRPNVAGMTDHDVTVFVNGRLTTGDRFVGFRLEPGDPATFDAFGFSGRLTFE